MKIEKVNDHQIRCTLTKLDLADRELKISELAYGTDKAKDLFRDMMQQASFEFGFEAEDIPLMIEAIPLNAECIVLIITKVEDPEELDTRFSNFAPSIHDSEEDAEDTIHNLSIGADDVLDLFKRIHEGKIGSTSSESGDNKSTSSGTLGNDVKTMEAVDLTKMYAIASLSTLTRLSHVLKDYYHGKNSLFKNPSTGIYSLVISKSDHTPEEFNKVCNIISEYGTAERFTNAGIAYLEEHFKTIVREHALQSLAQI
ncbi:MAG: adaptor protein MecA [Lachnospiraceae bacterium]